MAKRLLREQLYMAIAKLMAMRSTCMRGQVGCIIVADKRIISSGYNGPPKNEVHCSSETCDLNQTCKRAVHAEENAILFAAKHGISLEGSTLFVTTSPCYHCAKLIIGAGITRVYYQDEYREASEGLELLSRNMVDLFKVNKDAEFEQQIQGYRDREGIEYSN